MSASGDQSDHVKDKATNQESMPRAGAMGRRDFLKWMGLAGAVAVLGVGAGLRGLSSALAGAASEEQASAETVAVEVAQATPAATAQSTVAASQSSTSSTCTVRCRNACSYPGHCKRYADSNSNGRCDYGECL